MQPGTLAARSERNPVLSEQGVGDVERHFHKPVLFQAMATFLEEFLRSVRKPKHESGYVVKIGLQVICFLFDMLFHLVVFLFQ